LCTPGRLTFFSSTREPQGLPEAVHLLCPRQRRDDYGRYEGTNDKDKFNEAVDRRDRALSCLPILAFNQDGLEELQKWVWHRFSDALESCDFCIRMYHQGKASLFEGLKESYDDEDIEKLVR